MYIYVDDVPSFFAKYVHGRRAAPEKNILDCFHLVISKYS